MSDINNAAMATALWREMTSAALATLENSGLPHVSLVTIVPLEEGTAILLLSKLARHTKNLQRNPQCSLLVVNNGEDCEDILAQPRITVHGNVTAASKDNFDEYRAVYLLSHPAASKYIDFADLGFFRFNPEEIFLVGGFARIETISAKILSQNHHHALIPTEDNIDSFDRN